MQRNLDSGLSELNQVLLTMAGYVEKSLEAATAAWRTRDPKKIQEVYRIEEKVNQSHIEVDAACVKLLATQQPLATELRLVVSVIKINTDLERMVDLAVNIANNTEFYLKSSLEVATDDLS